MVTWRDAHGNGLFAHQLTALANLQCTEPKCALAILRTHGGWSMPKTKVLPKFSIGEKVRVRLGVCDPDYDDLTIGGWAGTVGEVKKGSPPTCLVRWNGETLKSQSPIYRKRCERDGFDGEEMWLGENDLEPDPGGPIKIEQPNEIVTKPLSMDDQDDRIRAVFGLTSDDPLPNVDFDSLLAYHRHLSESLLFPFEAEYSHETGPFQMTTRHITVTRPGEAGNLGSTTCTV